MSANPPSSIASSDGASPSFTELGVDKIFPVSAIHGEGIEPLLNAAIALLPIPSPAESVEGRVSSEEPGTRDTERASHVLPSTLDTRRPSPLKLAILGRP